MGFSAGTLFVTPTEGKGWSTEVTSAIKKPSRRIADLQRRQQFHACWSGWEQSIRSDRKAEGYGHYGTRYFRLQGGEIWHLLDRRANMPITMVDKYRLPDLDYSGYTHVILTNPLKVAGPDYRGSKSLC